MSNNNMPVNSGVTGSPGSGAPSNQPAQLEGDAIPGLTPPAKSGISMKAALALGLLVITMVAVGTVITKRYLDNKRAALPQKAPDVASAGAQRLRVVDPKGVTVPAFSGAPASAPEQSQPEAPSDRVAKVVPAIKESEVKPIELARKGDGRPGDGRSTTGKAAPVQVPVNPMDAPVFTSQTRAGGLQAQDNRARNATGLPSDDEGAEGSVARTIAELQTHKARLQAELDRQQGREGKAAGAASSRLAEANSPLTALTSRFGPPIMPDGSASQPGAAGRLFGALDHSSTSRVSAQRPFNRTLTVPKGVIFQCALKTRVVTATSGFVSCLVQRDVYGHDGKVVLVERGSNMDGEYRMVAVRPGVTRIPVVWTRILTPNAVSVDLESPAVGQLGESGIGGYVDNRWFERIGAALLVSMVDDAIKIAGQSNGDGTNGAVYLPSTQAQGSKLAEEVLKSTINIPPLLYQNQGGVVGVYVARDLDFSGVYRLVAQ